MNGYDSPKAVASLRDFFDVYREKYREPRRSATSRPGGWIFRGLPDLSHGLKTSLERACDAFKIELKKAAELEEQLLKDFRRRYPHYAPEDPPGKDQVVEWFALMQHHGAPTRLMDWTYSFFIAAFFALESAKPGRDSAVWALNSTWLYEELPNHLEKVLPGAAYLLERLDETRAKEDFDRVFAKSLGFIYPINPFRLNERLTIQQGVFICVGDPNRSFEKNLRATKLPAGALARITIKSQCRRDVLLALHRMNVNSAALFPGMDGFAKSLYTKMLILLQRKSRIMV